MCSRNFTRAELSFDTIRSRTVHGPVGRVAPRAPKVRRNAFGMASFKLAARAERHALPSTCAVIASVNRLRQIQRCHGITEAIKAGGEKRGPAVAGHQRTRFAGE